jgi:hypothetical protein
MKKLFWAASAVGIVASALMIAVQPAMAQGGILIKGTSVTSVYFLASDNKRYVFPNDKAYLSWYADFSGITVVSDQDLASFPIGGNVTYRPGKKLVKIQTDPKTYAVDKGGVLRWVTTEAVAAQLYGANWNQQIDDVPDIFFANYTIGAPIVSTSDYSVSAEMASVASINDDLSASSSTNRQPPPPSSCDQDIWSCSSWGSCSDSGTQSRTCDLAFDCPNASMPSPVLTQSCTQPAACTADTWSCGAWSACSNADTQTRNCTMTFDCPNVSTQSPALSQSCTPPTSCTADTWSCTAWSACSSGGTQARTCTMVYDCPSVTTPKPPESQSCTYQPGSLYVAASSTPVSQNYVKGSIGAPFMGISLTAGDASDVTIGSITVSAHCDGCTAPSPSDVIQTVKLWNGTTQVGSAQSLGTGDPGSATFSSLNVTVAAGQTLTLTLTGDLSSVAAQPNSLHFIVSSGQITATDAGGVAVSATGGTATGQVMHVVDSGSVTVTKAPDDSESETGLVVGGSSNIVLAKFSVAAQNEEMRLTKSLFHVMTPNTVSSLSLFDGSTLVGGPVPLDGNGNAFFPGMSSFIIPNDGNKTLIVKGTMNTVGSSGATSGNDAMVTLCAGIGSGVCSDDSGTFEARGAAAGSSTVVSNLAANVTGNSKIVRCTQPTVSLVALPSTTLIAGGNVVLRFTVSADASENVSLKGLTAQVSNGTAGGTITNINPGDSAVRRVGDSSNLAGTSSLTACAAGATCTLTMQLANEEVIAAGTSRTYEIRVNAGSPITYGDSITANLLGDTNLATGTLAAGDANHALTVGGTTSDFVWSDNSSTNHSDAVGSSSADWANGTYVKGVGTDTQTVSK